MADLLDDDQTAELAEIFRLMGDPSRLKILFACLDARRSVGDIAAAAGLSLSLVSHHLRLLRGARIVRAERQGKHIFYTAADDHIRGVLKDMAHHVAEEETE
jgi:DNA-binding transcriptional ArsR family regulator